MPKKKYMLDPWGELETELSQLTTMSQMLVELDSVGEPDRVDYFTERLPEHMGRINDYFQLILKQHLKDEGAAYEAKEANKPKRAPMSDAEKRALLDDLEKKFFPVVKE